MSKAIKTAVFVLLVAILTSIPLAFASGCDKYAEIYDTYYFESGTCMPTSNASDNIYIKKQENGGYNNINGAFNADNFRIKVERNKVTVYGKFSPVVAGVIVSFNVSAESQVVYTNIAYEKRDGGGYYEIYSDGEDTGIKVGVTGNSAVYEYNNGTGLSYQLVYSPR